MATRRALLAALSGALFAGTARAQQTVLLQERKETKMKITRAFSSPSKGPAEYFTGSVQIHSRYQGDAPARIGGAFVTFEPSARTAWHTHPLGQTLIVTSGKGWTKPRADQGKKSTKAMWSGFPRGRSIGTARRRQKQ